MKIDRENKSLSYRRSALNSLIIQTTHTVCILAILATHESFWTKITASVGAMCVTFIILPFEYDNCDQYHLLLQLICAFSNCTYMYILILLTEKTKFEFLS